MSDDEQKCEHKYLMLQRIQKTNYGGGYNTRYVQRERFVCERCLHERWVVKDDYSRDAPDWWKQD